MWAEWVKVLLEKCEGLETEGGGWRLRGVRGRSSG